MVGFSWGINPAKKNCFVDWKDDIYIIVIILRYWLFKKSLYNDIFKSKIVWFIMRITLHSIVIWPLLPFDFSALLIKLLWRSVLAKSNHPSRNGGRLKIACPKIYQTNDPIYVNFGINPPSGANFWIPPFLQFWS